MNPFVLFHVLCQIYDIILINEAIKCIYLPKVDDAVERISIIKYNNFGLVPIQ